MNPIVKAFLCGVYEIDHPLSVFRGTCTLNMLACIIIYISLDVLH